MFRRYFSLIECNPEFLFFDHWLRLSWMVFDFCFVRHERLSYIVSWLLLNNIWLLCLPLEQSKDGIFWMSWQDFQIHFRSIYVCRVYPSEMRYSVHGQWRGYSAGGCQDYASWNQNPQFRLRASGSDASFPIHVFITLTQVYLNTCRTYIITSSAFYFLLGFINLYGIYIGCEFLKNSCWF